MRRVVVTGMGIVAYSATGEPQEDGDKQDQPDGNRQPQNEARNGRPLWKTKDAETRRRSGTKRGAPV